MHSRVHDRIAAGLSLALLTALALFTFYLAQVADREERARQPRGAPSNEPDYFVDRLALLSMNERGEPSFRLEAQRLQHFPVDDATVFESPIVVSLDPGRPRLTVTARLPILCLGPSPAQAMAQATAVRRLGGRAVEAAGLPAEALRTGQGFAGAIWWGDETTARSYAQALAARSGPILPLITDLPDAGHATLERHACIDTTASGGNAQLLAEVAG